MAAPRLHRNAGAARQPAASRSRRLSSQSTKAGSECCHEDQYDGLAARAVRDCHARPMRPLHASLSNSNRFTTELTPWAWPNHDENPTPPVQLWQAGSVSENSRFCIPAAVTRRAGIGTSPETIFAGIQDISAGRARLDRPPSPPAPRRRCSDSQRNSSFIWPRHHASPVQVPSISKRALRPRRSTKRSPLAISSAFSISNERQHMEKFPSPTWPTIGAISPASAMSCWRRLDAFGEARDRQQTSVEMPFGAGVAGHGRPIRRHGRACPQAGAFLSLRVQAKGRRRIPRQFAKARCLVPFDALFRALEFEEELAGVPSSVGLRVEVDGTHLPSRHQFDPGHRNARTGLVMITAYAGRRNARGMGRCHPEIASGIPCQLQRDPVMIAGACLSEPTISDGFRSSRAPRLLGAARGLDDLSPLGIHHGEREHVCPSHRCRSAPHLVPRGAGADHAAQRGIGARTIGKNSPISRRILH